MKRAPWIVALIASLVVHGAIAIVTVPSLVNSYSAARNLATSDAASKAVFGFAIGWCVVVSIWCAMVANVLSREDNRWGGLKCIQLLRVVAGLTIALDLVNGPCIWTCPAIGLVVPILSYVAISNNSIAIEEEKKDADEPIAHG